MATIESLYYSVPETLISEKELVINTCNMIIKAFNDKCVKERERIQEELNERRNNRVYEYSIKTLEDGSRILHKKATEETKTNDDNDECWSKPFYIINGVLFHTEYAYRSKSWCNATKLIPQGIFDESTLESINKDW